jgi:hypothetical protein
MENIRGNNLSKEREWRIYKERLLIKGLEIYFHIYLTYASFYFNQSLKINLSQFFTTNLPQSTILPRYVLCASHSMTQLH